MTVGTDFHGDFLLHGLGSDLVSARAFDDGIDKLGVNPFFHFTLLKSAFSGQRSAVSFRLLTFAES
jgi:hypothetical protein